MINETLVYPILATHRVSIPRRGLYLRPARKLDPTRRVMPADGLSNHVMQSSEQLRHNYSHLPLKAHMM